MSRSRRGSVFTLQVEFPRARGVPRPLTWPRTPRRRSRRYTADRGMPGAFEGETVTRRGLLTGGALAAGGIAAAAFALPALGFALGPMFEDTSPDALAGRGPRGRLQRRDLRAEGDHDRRTRRRGRQDHDLRAQVKPGKDTVRRRPGRRSRTWRSPPAARTSAARCATCGASQRFICPCHGGVYDFEGAGRRRPAGAPARPLLHARRDNGRVEVGDRFSLNSKLERFAPRDPSNHLDGLWQYLYPSRPTT